MEVQSLKHKARYYNGNQFNLIERTAEGIDRKLIEEHLCYFSSLHLFLNNDLSQTPTSSLIKVIKKMLLHFSR
jgi:hypothetical protein